MTESQIITAFRKMKSNPTGGQNGLFHEHRSKMLSGKIHKMYVGGNERYRIMNIVIAGDTRIVLPFYISEVKRKDFNYDTVNWLEIAEFIYAALTSEKDKFERFDG
jgi:hypothetical protein